MTEIVMCDVVHTCLPSLLFYLLVLLSSIATLAFW